MGVSAGSLCCILLVSANLLACNGKRYATITGSTIISSFINHVLSPKTCFPEPSQTCEDMPKSSDFRDSRANSSFYLFTRRNRDVPEFLHLCGCRLPKYTHFNASHRTEFIIVGFTCHVCFPGQFLEIKDELLRRGEFNVILMDFDFEHKLDYISAAKYSRIVAVQAVSVIRNIMNRTGVRGENFHIVGHSLGGQIAGQIGQRVKVRRITGLDPTGRLFPESKPLDSRLDPTDADLVDNIHTDMEIFGMQYSAGHADFYVEDRKFIEKCVSVEIGSSRKGISAYISYPFVKSYCMHLRALEYYRDSINPGNCPLVGVRCDSPRDFREGRCGSCEADDCACAVMGFDFEEYIRRKSCTKSGLRYQVDVDENSSYCQGANLNKPRRVGGPRLIAGPRRNL